MSDTNSNIRTTFKSQDTEEWLDVVFTRPIGYQWAKLFQRLGVHPNTVTIISMILGAASGWFFMHRADTWEGLLYNIGGVLLLMWANFYDSCDGQLARMTGKKTRMGRILDGFAGDVWFFSIYAFVIIRLFPQNIPFTTATPWQWWIVAVAALSGLVCHSAQCRIADYYRNIHLYFVKGESGSELDSYRQQQELYRTLDWSDGAIYKLSIFFYRNYVRSQERATPCFQAFMAKVRELYGTDIPHSVRSEFRRLSLPLMKYTNILTFNTRAIALYISCLIDLPWLYFAFELTVLTALYAYMHWRHETMCRQFLLKLQTAHGN